MVDQPAASHLAYTVDAGRWADLPPEVAALVAPPVVVSAGRSAGPAPRPAADAATAAEPARSGGGGVGRHRIELLLFRSDRQMIAPAPPRPGRHRRHARAG